MTNLNATLFSTGQIAATPGAVALLAQTHTHPRQLLDRHFAGDFGEVCPEDYAANIEALAEGLRIMSVYSLQGGRLWIITEADRSVTTLLLPEEY